MNPSYEAIPREGLTRDQWRFLTLRPGFPTDAACAVATGVKPQTIRAWRHRSGETGAFREAERLLWEDRATLGKQAFRDQLLAAAETNLAALTAVTSEGNPDWRARGRAVTAVLRVNGLLDDVAGTDASLVRVIQETTKMIEAANRSQLERPGIEGEVVDVDVAIDEKGRAVGVPRHKE